MLQNGFYFILLLFLIRKEKRVEDLTKGIGSLPIDPKQKLQCRKNNQTVENRSSPLESGGIIVVISFNHIQTPKDTQN